MIPFDEGRLLLIDKPYGKTSFQAVKHVKYLTKAKKVGHAGTLDPLATGLLIICTGKWTKKISDLQIMEKEYTGTLVLGATRPSFDMETEIEETFDYSGITEEEIRLATRQFMGRTEQTPPVFSAVKVDGKRAYESARKGKEVIIQPKMIEIKEFEITGIDLPNVDFRVVCGKGTYIRTLVSDLGKALNNGAYLSALRRTRIGDHEVKNAFGFDEFAEWAKAERNKMLPES